MSSCLFECLKEAGLERYYSTLQHRGYDTAFSLLYIPTAELQAVGISTDSDRQRFLQLVQIIASFHQGGELSPRRSISPSRSPKVKLKSRQKREMRTSTTLSFQNSDSSTTSEESPAGYIPSPRRKNRSNSASNIEEVNSANMPVLTTQKLHRKREQSKDRLQSPLYQASAGINSSNTRNENNFNIQDNNNNSIMHENIRPITVPVVSLLTEDSDEISSATKSIRMSADCLKVQKVMRTKRYNYGLPRDGHKQNGVSGLTPKMHRRVAKRTPISGFSTPKTNLSQNSRDSIGSNQGIQGRITVCVRKRPILPPEFKTVGFDVVTCNQEDGGKEGGIVVHELKHTVDMSEYVQQNVFQFDKVFTERTTNKDIYEGAVKPMVDWVMTENHRATCFGYGQTGAGKTHTLLGDEAEAGVFFHAAHDLLSRINGQHTRQNRTKRGCFLSVSLYEIYCSRIFDLLNGQKRLQALEDSNKQIHIHGLKAVQVNNMQTLQEVVNKGLSSRSVGVTGANQDSSRSHAIVQLSLRDANNAEFSRLSFIDLAGSERACDALRDSDKQNRLEGAEINQSLLALKECIRSLDLALAHTPFRQSKLTQVLRDSFIGNSKTCMIANISPSYASLEHTMNTLRYASRVKELHRKPNFSTPRQRNRSNANSVRSAQGRPFTADPIFSRSRPTVAASPRTPSLNLSRSVSIDNGIRVMDYSAFTGQGRELSRTPPPTSNTNLLDVPQSSQRTQSVNTPPNSSIINTNDENSENNLKNSHGKSKSLPIRKIASIFTPGAIDASSTPHKSTEKSENSKATTRPVLTELSANDTSSPTSTPASTPRFLNDTEPVGGVHPGKCAEVKENNHLNCKTTHSTELESDSRTISLHTTVRSSTNDKLTDAYSNSNPVTADRGSSKESKRTMTVSKSGTSHGTSSNLLNDNSKTRSNSTDKRSEVENEKLSDVNQSEIFATNSTEATNNPALPESRKNPGLPSPQKFLTYLKGKHNMKKKALKQQLRKARRRDSKSLEDEGQISDHSASSSTRSTNTHSSSCSTRRSSLMMDVQLQLSSQNVGGVLPESVIITNVPSPPRLPSPKLDQSQPRRSSRVLHGSRSSSPGSGGRNTPDERSSVQSTSSNPATTTGLTSASELHARLEAAASNRQSRDDLKTSGSEKLLRSSSKNKTITEATRISSSSDKENLGGRSKQEERVHRAQSEVIIAHQEHISEILRISIEEERLYHELRDQWGKGTSFETYTKSLQMLLARKTQSIDALKLQFALYERVRNAPV